MRAGSGADGGRGTVRGASRSAFSRTLTGSMSGKPLFATYAPAAATAPRTSRPSRMCTRERDFFFRGFPSRRLASPTCMDVAMSLAATMARDAMRRARGSEASREWDDARARGPVRGAARWHGARNKNVDRGFRKSWLRYQSTNAFPRRSAAS